MPQSDTLLPLFEAFDGDSVDLAYIGLTASVELKRPHDFRCLDSSFYVSLVYGPLAAWLVELFPPRIRYTFLSVPYHIAVGWLGGFLPTVAFAVVAITGNIYSGLWYPVVVAAASACVGAFFLPDTRGDSSEASVGPITTRDTVPI